MGLTPRSLEAPLPTGMRDRLPHEAEARRALVERMLARAGAWGYGLIDPPSFEFASVLERGLPGGEGADVLRFVEPESGEVAALRPDVTPQVARILALCVVVAITKISIVRTRIIIASRTTSTSIRLYARVGLYHHHHPPHTHH